MNNINTIDRTFRIALSIGIVLVLMATSGPLGTLAYAVFVSIYAGISGFIGWDPLIAAMGNVVRKSSAKPISVSSSRLLTH